MSSKILDRGRKLEIPPLTWKHVGPGMVCVVPGQGSPVASGRDCGSGQTTAAGPTWDQYHALEVRLRELEQQLPLREQQARQTALREGEATAAARWEAAVEKLARAIGEITSCRPRLRREAEQDVVKLSLAIARRVMRRELTIDPDALLGLIKTAFEKLDAREIHRVRIRPEDAALVSAWLERIGGPSRIEVQSDSGLERGAVIVESGRGNLDISLDTQLEEIERGFADLLQRRLQP